MMRLSAAVLLLCLFTLSAARIPPATDDVTTSTSVSLISLPESQENKTESQPDSSSSVTSVPLTKITFHDFHPINRRFRPRHPCRHHFRVDQSKREAHVEIPYSTDMILSSAGRNGDFDNPAAVRGGIRRWARMHHHHDDHHEDSDSDSDEDEDEDEKKMKRIMVKKEELDRFDGEMKGYKEWKKMIKKERSRHHQKGEGRGFMTRVRKFLDRYF